MARCTPGDRVGAAVRVLITGGAGYLGSVLCEHLLRSGYQVTVVDSLTYRQHGMFQLAHSPNLEF